MNYGRCITCGAPGVSRERRPNGNTICANGHKHSSAAFDRHQGSAAAVQALSPKVDKLQQYRDKMEGPMEALAHTFDDLGISPDQRLNDDEIVARAGVKLRQMHKMLLASGMTEPMLNAVMAG